MEQQDKYCKCGRQVADTNKSGFCISCAQKGKSPSLETREKLSIAGKGRILTEEHKRKISESHKGKLLSEETKKKLSKIHTGKKMSIESRKKMSLQRAGKLNARWGKKLTKTHIDLLSKSRTEKCSGENNHAWLGGKSFEPYTLDFNNVFKEAVRDRDNHCCSICNKHEEELDKKLAVHHVDYVKANSFKENCASLCNSCHAKTNINRVQWKVFFQSLLSERYNYNYTEDKKIILDLTEIYNNKIQKVI